MNSKSLIERQIAGHEALTRGDYARINGLTLNQRAELLDAACEAAMELTSARRRLGLPPVPPTPWPDSTWEVLRRFAPNGRHD